MAFDVEAARKAGYSDAEIADYLGQQFKFDAKAARGAGYSDSELIAHLAGMTDKPGQIPGQAPDVKAPAPDHPVSVAGPEPGLVDQAIGAGEALLTLGTGATGGALGMIGGALKGLAEQILSGQFGTPQAAALVEKAATEGGSALTYRPRTQAGQDAVEGFAEFANRNLTPLAGLAGTLPALSAARGAPASVLARAGAEGVARDVAGPVAASAVAKVGDVASNLAGSAVKGATTLPRRAVAALSRDAAAQPAPGTMGSVGAAGTDMAAQRRALASDLPVPINLTKGQASRDPAQLKFEVETAKLPDAGTPLRQRYVQQNEQILRNFDAWIDQTGGEAPNLRAVGQSVDTALVKQAKADKAAVNAAYARAKRSPEASAIVDQSLPVSIGEGDAAITGTPIAYLNEQPAGLPNTGLVDAARQYAVRLGIADMQDGQLVPKPASIRQLEDWRKAISGATGFEPADIRQSTILKGMIDAQTEPVAGPLFRQARGLRQRYAQNYEDRASIAKLLGTKRGMSDRQVALEDVFDHSILRASTDDVRNVRRVLQRSGPEGQQAWRDLQGATATWIRDQASSGSATDSMGNRVVSVAGLDKAIRTLDADGRLDFVFGKQGAQRMRDIRDLAQIARTVPPEAAVNTSNTASALLAGFADVGASGISGIPLPVATMVRVVRQHVKDSALRRRIEDALGDLRKKEAPGQAKPPLQAPRTLH